MKSGLFNCIIDGQHGSSGKGKLSTYLASLYKVNNVSSSNFPNAGHCQVWHTNIITNNGLEKLGDVVTSRKASASINKFGVLEDIGDFVPDGVRVTNLIELNNGIYLECTDEHKYLVWDSSVGAKVWVKSMDLDPNIHQFIFPKSIQFPDHNLFDGSYVHTEKRNKTEIKLPKNELLFAQYLGLLVGNGYYASGRRVDLAFHSSQLDVLERMHSLYNEMGMTNISVSRVGEKECFVISTGQISGLLDIFRSVGLELATKDNKTTPKRVLLSNRRVLAAYLQGLFDSDGCAKTDRVTFSNCSENVVRDAQQLLYILGVHSNLTFYDDTPGRTGSDRLRQWILTISGVANLKVFQEVVGFISAVKSSKLQACIDGYTREQGQVVKISREVRKNVGLGKSGGNSYTSFVVSMEDALHKNNQADELLNVCKNYHIVSISEITYENREVEVFDITAPVTHSYLANGCISHNTAIVGKFKFVSKVLPTPAILKMTGEIFNIRCWVSPASGFDIARLEQEMRECDWPTTYIHGRASIVTADHAAREQSGSESTKHIASTMQGSGTALADKIMRRQDVKLAHSPSVIDQIRDTGAIVLDSEIFRETARYHMNKNTLWLHEISQGFALSIDHGSHYPACTSRNLTVSRALDDFALPPSMVGDVYLNIRPFPIRVGNVVQDGQVVGNSGDFYEDSTELTWRQVGQGAEMPEQEILQLEQRELTTVTKRVRRVSTFSWNGLDQAVMANNPTCICLNFAQYLDWSDAGKEGTGKVAWSKLSYKTRRFIDDIENRTNVPVMFVGTGPANHQMVALDP